MEPTTAKQHFLIASAATKGIYYNFKDHFPPIISSIPRSIDQNIHPPSFTDQWQEQSTVPSFPVQMKTTWLYSRASLNGVQAVRKSRRRGVELRYNGFSKCLGDFRPDEALEWIESPRWFSVSRMDSLHHDVDFHEEQDVSGVQNSRSMGGFLIIWFWMDMTIIQTD